MTSLHSSTQRRSTLGRMFTAALATALVLSTAPPARAAPPAAAQSATLTVSPSSITICEGQTGTVKVTARLRTARGAGRRPSPQPLATSTLTAEASNSSTSVSPDSDELTFQDQATMQFRITGNRVGEAAVVFRMNAPGPEDELVPLVGPKRSEARAAFTMDVKVRECKYILVLKSKWYIQRAWNYDYSSRLRAELVPNADGSFAVLAVVQNTHTQRIRLGGPCSKTPTVETTRADVDGTIDNRSGKLDFKVKYDPVRAAVTDVKCRTPFGTIGAQAEDTGLPEIFNPQPVSINAQVGGPGTSVSGAYRHDLHTDLGNVGTAGRYTIKTVER